MGGQGSGRPPSVETLTRVKQDFAPIAESFVIPNYSGLQDVKKTDPAIVTGATVGDIGKNWLVVSGSYTIGDNWLLVSGSYTTGDNWLAVSGSYQTLANNNWLAVSGSYDAGRNWLVVSGSYLTAETDPVWLAQSGGYVLDASANYQTLTDGSNADALHTHAGVGAETDPIWIATSGSYVPLSMSGSWTATANASGSFLTSYTETDPRFMALSGAFLKTEADPVYAATSGTFVKMAMSGNWNTAYTHSQDNTQAHSDYVLNSGTDTTVGPLSMSSDQDASGSAMFRNIIIDSTSGNYPTPSAYTQGTLLLVYS